jgi:pimeloyl-ACP methyl ester carboxylesterase
MHNALRIAASPLIAALLIGAPAHIAFSEEPTSPAAESGPAEPAASQVAASGDFAGLVDIGGRRLYLACKGSGTPTVILKAGANNNGAIRSEVDPKVASKTSVFDGVAQFTRVCAYDRLGTIADSETILRSRSDPAPMPRNASDVVADLSALLAAVGVRPPYVLVGHSFGGLAVGLFASTLPSDDVVGLVLVDAAQEEFWAKLEALVRPEQWKGMISAPPPPELADYHDFERLDVDASAVEMRKAAVARPLSKLSLIVLSRGLPMELPPDAAAKLKANFSAEQERIWQTSQDKLVALVPGAEHAVATKSGHYIQTMQPDLVIDAVRDVVEAVRWGSPVVVTPDRP